MSGLRAQAYDILIDADLSVSAAEALEAPGGPGRGTLADPSR